MVWRAYLATETTFHVKRGELSITNAARGCIVGHDGGSHYRVLVSVYLR